MKLYLVPTPIGNLEDMTFRAIKVLKEVDFILAEDTRTSGKLMKHFEIATQMHSHHMHNEHKSIEGILNRIKNGETCAVISDAGTPAISDPGFLLTRACVENNIEVECLPGATAFVPALVNSGLPNDKFVFEGFLPVKKGRQTRLLLLAEETRTMIFYESSKQGDEEFYYPVNTQDNLQLYKKYRVEAESNRKVIVGGRLGSYAYYDMDKTILAAMSCYERKIAKNSNKEFD